jgi:hypothetical protein
MSTISTAITASPKTAVVRELMAAKHDPALLADLLFLERWEAAPAQNTGSVLRLAQIRRALPDVAAAVRAEMKGRK